MISLLLWHKNHGVNTIIRPWHIAPQICQSAHAITRYAKPYPNTSRMRPQSSQSTQHHHALRVESIPTHARSAHHTRSSSRVPNPNTKHICEEHLARHLPMLQRNTTTLDSRFARDIQGKHHQSLNVFHTLPIIIDPQPIPSTLLVPSI